jgi:hypothetical protein
MTSVIGDTYASRETEGMKSAKSAAKKTSNPPKGEKPGAKPSKGSPKKASKSEPLANTAGKTTALKKLGVLSAAYQVLAASATPMTSQEMIEAMAAQKLWSSPNGKTPAQTLYAAIMD